MNILLSAYSCCPNKGSEEGNGWNWAIQLSRKVSKVYCYTRSIHKDAILYELEKLNIKNLYFVFIDPPAFFERHYKSNKVGLYLHYIIWQWYAYVAAKRSLKCHLYDMVHHVTFASLQLGSFMYRLKIPFVFGPVGGGQVSPRAFKSYFGKYWKIELARNFISYLLLKLNPATRNSIRKANVVLVSNQETKRLAIKLGAPNPYLFFDTGLPTHFFPINKPRLEFNGCLNILWVGRLLPRKGLKLVLDSLALIKEKVNFKLTIVGDGEMGEFVFDWIKELGLQKNVEWLGQIPFEEVKGHYLKSNLFILTSLRDSCPAQLLEAMSYGLPIITLDLHGASLAVPNDAGIKILPIDPEQTKNEIAQAIVLLSKDSDLLVNMGSKGYEFALLQTWDHKVQYVVDKFYPKSNFLQPHLESLKLEIGT